MSWTYFGFFGCLVFETDSMQRSTIALLRIPNCRRRSCASFLTRSPPPSTCLLPCSPEVGEVAPPIGASETRKPSVRKARKLKADTIDCGSPHAQLPSSIPEEIANARPTSPKARRRAKAGAKPTQLLDSLVPMAEDVLAQGEETTAQNAATGKAQDPAFPVKSVFEDEVAVKNAGTDDGAAEIVFDATVNGSLIKEKKELSQWFAKQDLSTFRYGCRWEETAYKLLDFGISPAHIMKMVPKCRTVWCGGSTGSMLKVFTMLGMSREQMGYAISQWPSVLNMSTNCLQSKVEFFESIGVDKDLVAQITAHPRIFLVSLSTLKGRCDFWKDCFQDVQDKNTLRTLMTSNPQILTMHLQKAIIQKIAFLEVLGFSKKMLLRQRAVLSCLCSCTTLKLHTRLHTLLVLGFSFDRLQKVPHLLFCSEEYINSRLCYAVNVMNLSLDTLVAGSHFWYRSEKVIKYRYEVLQELRAVGAYRKIISLGYLVGMSNEYFCRRFVGALQAYTKPSNI